jgi:hypothetical protein
MADHSKMLVYIVQCDDVSKLIAFKERTRSCRIGSCDVAFRKLISALPLSRSSDGNS